MVKSQTELLSSAVTVWALELCSRKIVQFDFLHQERARHDGTIFAPTLSKHTHHTHTSVSDANPLQTWPEPVHHLAWLNCNVLPCFSYFRCVCFLPPDSLQSAEKTWLLKITLTKRSSRAFVFFSIPKVYFWYQSNTVCVWMIVGGIEKKVRFHSQKPVELWEGENKSKK